MRPRGALTAPEPVAALDNSPANPDSPAEVDNSPARDSFPDPADNLQAEGSSPAVDWGAHRLRALDSEIDSAGDWRNIATCLAGGRSSQPASEPAEPDPEPGHRDPVHSPSLTEPVNRLL